MYRLNPTKLSDKKTPPFFKDPQLEPGNILIGHRWPDEVRFILKETKVVDDLLYLNKPAVNKPLGVYKYGVVMLYATNQKSHGFTLAHEIAHAHQHALIPINSTPDLFAWTRTKECEAYIDARKKDWEEFGKAKYDTNSYFSYLPESAAEFCSYFWSIGRWEKEIHNDLKKKAPNRLKWAQEWLTP